MKFNLQLYEKEFLSNKNFFEQKGKRKPMNALGLLFYNIFLFSQARNEGRVDLLNNENLRFFSLLLKLADPIHSYLKVFQCKKLRIFCWHTQCM